MQLGYYYPPLTLIDPMANISTVNGIDWPLPGNERSMVVNLANLQVLQLMQKEREPFIGFYDSERCFITVICQQPDGNESRDQRWNFWIQKIEGGFGD